MWRFCGDIDTNAGILYYLRQAKKKGVNMVTISMNVEVTFLEWDSFDELIGFLMENHNTGIDLVTESDAQNYEITNVEVINERAD